MSNDPNPWADYPKLVLVLAIIASALSVPALSQRSVTGPSIQETVFANVFSAITAAQASSPIRNIGQAMHTVQVTFPSENTAVTGIQVRLEWARATGDWRPAGPDIVGAPVLSQGTGETDVVAYETYYGVFRAIRINNVVPTPGGEELTVRYLGHIVPVVPFVTLKADRWAF